MTLGTWNVRRLWARLLVGLAAPGLLSLGAAAADAPAPVADGQQQTLPAAAPAFELDAYRATALEKQPSLSAYRASVDAAQAKAHGLDSLFLAGLLRHDLPTRRKQSQLGILAAQAQLNKAEWDTVYSATRTYLSAVYASKQLQVADKALGPEKDVTTLNYLRKLANSIYMPPEGNQLRRDVRQWHVAQLDVLIQVTRGRSEEARQGVERALAALREAIGLAPDTPLTISQEFPAYNAAVPDRATIVALALDRRGEIAQARVGTDVTALEIEAQKVLNGGRAETFASASDLHAQPIPQGVANEEYRPGAISVEMPANLVGHRAARVEQAHALHDRAQAVLEKTGNLLTLEAEDTWLRWREDSRKAEEYAKAAAEAEKIAERIRDEFSTRLGRQQENTRPNFDDLSQARVRATQLRLHANQAQYELLLTLAALERITAGGFCANFAPLAPKTNGK
ncbi:MAG TPA: TolC family protein [Gemmataceae bacterium]|nr:TolC family protein [Gemmataceae bacterium]